MRIFLGTDHAGYELKEHLKAALGGDAVDCGAEEYDPDDDYPAYCVEAATRAVAEGTYAVVIGGSGNGEQIAANKVPGARAALCWSEEIARLAREHNDANVCSLGARFLTHDEAERIVRIFVETPFSGDERHVRRLAQVATYDLRATVRLVVGGEVDGAPWEFWKELPGAAVPSVGDTIRLGTNTGAAPHLEERRVEAVRRSADLRHAEVRLADLHAAWLSVNRRAFHAAGWYSAMAGDAPPTPAGAPPADGGG